jgi:NitT/TauT family transport system substrate-binding protein
MTATPETPQFRILVPAASESSTPSDLRHVPIAVSQGTVIEYVTTRLLEAEGLAPGEIETLAVPKIPDRMPLLAAGELQAATLPEPMGSLAQQQGARLIIADSSHPEYSCSLFAFRSDVVETQPDTVRRFLHAVERASTAINADKTRWADLLTEQALVPAALRGSYILPDYPAAAVPSESQYADVAAWLAEAGLLDEPAPYTDVVKADYLDR